VLIKISKQNLSNRIHYLLVTIMFFWKYYKNYGVIFNMCPLEKWLEELNYILNIYPFLCVLFSHQAIHESRAGQTTSESSRDIHVCLYNSQVLGLLYSYFPHHQGFQTLKQFKMCCTSKKEKQKLNTLCLQN